jgi:hypothetical protein
MARFPNFGHPPAPQVGTGGFVKPGAPTTPVPGPVAPAPVGGGNVSFTVGGPTLQALQERQQRLQQAAPELPPPSGMISPWQGVSYLANTFVNQLQQNRAAAEEQRGQQELAQALTTGLDPATGTLKPEAMATVMARDPEMGLKFISDMITQRRSQVRTVTGDEATKLNLDPTQTWQVDNTGHATNITPTEQTQYRPMTVEEYKQFNIPVDPTTGQPTKPYRWNIKERKPEAIGGEPQSAQPMTDWQNRDLGYYHQGSLANDSLSETGNDALLADQSTAFWTGLGDWSQNSLVKAFANKQLTPQQQAAINDAVNFAAAVNRKESGATLTESELQGTIARYIPVYGDSPETVAKKRAARAEKLKSFTFGLTGRPELDAAEKDLQAGRDQRRKEREAQGGGGGGGGGAGRNITNSPANTFPDPGDYILTTDPKTGKNIRRTYKKGDPNKDSSWDVTED